MRFLLIAAAITVLLAACAQPAQQQPQSSPSPAATPTATATPAASPSPAAYPSPSPGVPAASVAPGTTVAPVAVPSATKLVVLPPDAAPRILAVHVDKTVVASGDVVSGSVETSSNVASVEARIASYGITVPKTSEGRFALHYRVPDLPFFLKKTYDMVVIARNTAGVKTERVVPITIR